MKSIVSTRNYGIDLLRIVAMFMVLLLHILGHGGVLKSLLSTPPAFLSKYTLVWLIEIGAYCAVNSYAILTGYNYYGKNISLNKIVNFWFQVAFYSIGISVLFFIMRIEISNTILFKSIFPIMASCYWYITAYFGMFLFIPVMNHYIEYSNRKNIEVVLVTVFFSLSVFPTICNIDPFKLHSGYSMVWLVVLYLFGAYLKKFNLKEKFTRVRLLKFYFGIVLFTWLSKIGIEIFTFNFIGKLKYSNTFVKYTSPTIVLAAIFLVLFFSCIDVKNVRWIKIVDVFSSASLGVYLIHEHPLVRAFLVKNSMVTFTKYSSLKLVLAIFLVAVISYLVFTGIELLRIKIFKCLNTDEKINSICLWINKKISIFIS